MDKYTTSSTSAHSQKVDEPIVIEEGETTRKVFLAEINDTKTETGETVGGTLVHQRKARNNNWEPVDAINLQTLKAGEGVKLKLRSGPVKKLYDGLTQLYELSKKGVKYGKTEYVVAPSDEVITIPRERAEHIRKLIQADHAEEIWEQLIEMDPDLATKLSHARIHNTRKKSLSEFEESINDKSKKEDYWQAFFTGNDWIFGYGLNYKFLNIESDQPNYGGENYQGKGKQKGDYLTYSESDNAKFTVLVEIKRPDSLLLTISPKKKENVRYRNGAWLLGRELLGGVSQIQVNCKSWQEESQELKNRELINRRIYTVRPKGILIIGNTAEFGDDLEKVTSFELFRQSISNVEIITFDELLERAKFILGQDNPVGRELGETAEDIPF
jgi:Domain of unknown function (DUF4263)